MKRVLAICTVLGLLTPALAGAQPPRSADAESARRDIGVVRKLDTVAALRALTDIPADDRFDVSGYYAPNDGGGASYLWSSTSTAKDDGGAVIQPEDASSKSPGRFLLIWDGNHANVKVWGAKGDGSTDDLAAIDAAISALPVNNFDNPVQSPGAGRSGAYRLGTLIFPPGGTFMVSDTVYISPRMEVILDGTLKFLGGAAPSATTEKFVLYTLTGSNAVGNPNTSFGVSIHGRGDVIAGSPAENPGGSGIFWQNANYGGGVRDIVIGECALRGLVVQVQGGNVDGLWVVGPIWQGPGLDVQPVSQDLVIGRASVEHVNPSIHAAGGTRYYYDAAGYPIPAVRLQGHNITVGDLQTEISPLSVLIDCQGCTINSVWSNQYCDPNATDATYGQPDATNAGLVKIQGQSTAVQLFALGSIRPEPYAVLDVSDGYGDAHNIRIPGNRGPISYIQKATTDNLVVGTSITSPRGPVSVVNQSGALAALFGATGSTAQIQLSPGNNTGYGVIFQSDNKGDKVGADGRYRYEFGSLWNTNYTEYGEWSYQGLNVLGSVTASSLKTAVKSLTGATPTADWSASGSATLTLIANATIAFANNASGQSYSMAITNTGSYTVTWPTSVKWPGGTAPTQTTGAHTDIYTLTQVGATIYGNVVQNY